MSEEQLRILVERPIGTTGDWSRRLEVIISESNGKRQFWSMNGDLLGTCTDKPQNTSMSDDATVTLNRVLNKVSFASEGLAKEKP